MNHPLYDVELTGGDRSLFADALNRVVVRTPERYRNPPSTNAGRALQRI